MNSRIITKAILFAIAAIILHILASIAWLAVYAGAIDPGHALSYYEAYAVRTVDRVGMIAGIPILFAFGWLIGRRALTRAEGFTFGAMVGVAFIAIDLIVLFAFSGGVGVGLQGLILSYATKLAAAAMGGWLAAGGSPKAPPEPAA